MWHSRPSRVRYLLPCRAVSSKLWLNYTLSFYCYHSALFLLCVVISSACWCFPGFVSRCVCCSKIPAASPEGGVTVGHAHARCPNVVKTDFRPLSFFLNLLCPLSFFSLTPANKHTHPHGEQLNWLVSFNQMENKRIPDNLKLTSLMGLGGEDKLWRQKGERGRSDLKCTFIFWQGRRLFDSSRHLFFSFFFFHEWL